MSWRRTLFRALTGTVVAVTLIAVVGQFFLTSSPGRTLVLEGVLPTLSQMLGHTLHVEQTSGFWPREIVLNGVTVSDRAGKWLEIDKLLLTWNPTALLHGQISIDTLNIHNMHLIRLPAGKAPANPMALPNFFALGKTLDGIQAESVAVELLRVDPGILGEATTVSIQGSLKPDGAASILNIAVDRKDAPGSAVLALKLGDDVLSLDAQADLAGIGLTAVTSVTGPAQTLKGSIGLTCDGTACPAWSSGGIGTATMEAVFSGTRKDPAADITFNISSVKTGTRTLETAEGVIAVRPDSATQTLRLDGHGTLKGVNHLLPDIAAVIAADGTWALGGSVTPDATNIESLVVKTGDTTATVAGTLTGSQMSGAALTLDVRGLGRLASLDDPSSSTHAIVKMAKGTITPDVTGTGTVLVDIENPPDALALAPSFRAPMKLKAAFALAPDSVNVTNISALWGPATLKGESAFARTDAGLDHTASTAALTIAPETFPGQTTSVQADSKLSGGFSALTAAVTATLQEYQRGAAQLDTVKVGLQAKHEPRGWQGTLHGDFKLNGAPVTLSTTASQSAGAVVLRDVAIVGAGANLKGALHFGARGSASTGMLAGPMEDLTPWTALAGLPAAGRGDFKVALSGTAQPRAELTLDTHDFSSSGITADNLKLTAEIDDPFASAALKIHAAAYDGGIVGRRFDQMTADVVGSPKNMAVTVKARGDRWQVFALDLKGTVGFDEKTEVALSRFVLKDGAVEADLPEPAHLTLTDDTLTLAPLHLAVGTGAVDAKLSVMRKTGQVNGRLALTAITIDDPKDPLSLGQTFVDGTIDISGRTTQADVAAALTARFKPREGGAPVVGTLTARVQNGRAAIMGAVNGLSAEDARLVADVPAKIDVGALRLDMDMQANATARLTWHGDIKPLWLMLGNDRHTLAGQTDVDVKLAGTLGAPAVTGGIRFTKGFYENLESGTALHNIDLDIATQSTTLVNLKLTATDTGSGRLSAEGIARDGGQDEGWSVDATGDLHQFHILRRDDITAAASGHVTYKGPLRAGTLGGNLEIVRSEYRLGESYEPEILLLRGLAARAATSSPVSKIKLDVALSIPEVLRTDGQGLEAFWRGGLKATGDLNHPDLVGQLTLARGTFSFLGKTFDLDSGTVTFTGGGRIDPELNIVAVREAEDITATLTISGRASKPQIALSSRPALPQDEVLARLLFRKGTTQLGPIESLQLANAAADLSGLSRGGLSGVLRRASGLDIVGFGGASGNAIVLGRQVSSAVYVGIEQNVNDSSRRIVVEWRLTPQFSLQSTTTDETGADLGVVWRKNY